MNIFKQISTAVMLAVLLITVPCISYSADAEKKPAATVPTATISTQFGDIVIKFRPDVAPKHVENFVKLAKQGFFDRTIFHRVIPGFMIQGGDPNTKSQDETEYGMGGPGYTIKAEFSKVSHKRGIVSMARSQDIDSAGSQFFIVVRDSTFLDKKYTVFGEVVSGMEVADKIVSLPRNSRDVPTMRIEMTVKVNE